MKAILTLATLSISLATARPANDWNKPCFNGECAYDLPQASKRSGTLKISGPASLITDITPSAGWVMLSCDPQALAQDIRIVCKDVNEEAAGCSHLFQDGGPVNKLVRLPENCSSAPFARIAHHEVAQDQSIPAAAHAKLQSRGGSVQKVHILKIDTNFDAVDNNRSGTVSFILHAANFPVGDLESSADHIGMSARDGDAFIHKSLAAFAQWNIDKSLDIHVGGRKTVNVLAVVQSCPVEAALKVDITCKVAADVSLGIVASGSILPPSVTKLGVYAKASKAEVGASIVVDAALSGSIDSKEKLAFQQPFPGINIPGILSLTPKAEIRARALASVGLKAQAEIGLNFRIEDIGFYFPPSAGRSTGNFLIQDTPFKLSASAGIDAKAELSGHLIGRLVFGLNFFSIAKASVYFAGDASATLNIEGHASASTKRSYIPPYGEFKEIDTRMTDTGSFAGCVGLSAQLSIKAGAEGSIFGLWDPTFSAMIAEHKWLILKKCIGIAVKRSPNTLSSLEARSPGLVCFAANVGAAVAAFNEVIKASDIKLV